MLRNQDEDELKQILSETFSNNYYIDEQIGHLLSPSEVVQIRRDSESIKSSDGSQNNNSNSREDFNFKHQQEEHEINPFYQFSREVPKEEGQSREIPRHIFDDIYRQINGNLKAEGIQLIRQKYPLFLLSQPSYEIKDHVKQINVTYSGGLLRRNILIIDVGYCEQEKVFKVACGTDEGDVIVFQPNSSKPQRTLKCFKDVCTITSLKWSKNLQYLAVSNDDKEVWVYCFKQIINIQNNITFRILKTPVQYFSLNEKSLKHSINQLYLIEESPFIMVVVDENQDIYKVQMKKHIINMKPYLSSLPITFNNFFDLAFMNIKDQNKNQGVLMAVAGFEFVTICLFQPVFQVAMVYDKQKHGGHIKKNGYPQISFRSNPNSLMIIWDKYLEILNIEIAELMPLHHKITISHKFLFPDSAIIGGFLSSSLIYQVSRVGLKIYSITTFEKDLLSRYKSKEVYSKTINFNSLYQGQKVEEFISNHLIQVEDLRYLKGLFHVANRTLFYSTSTSLQMLYFSTLNQYVMNLVDNNNWKIALQILKDCYLGQIYELDEMHPSVTQTKIKQVSRRYVNFLQTIMVCERGISSNTNMELLWNQQLIFIFNILISTGLQIYLLNDMLPKIHKLNPIYVSNIIPFILMNKITQITHDSLVLLLSTVPKQIISRLLFNMQPVYNDSELPHQINNLMIRESLMLQLVDLNQKFGDHYTPLAVLVSVYLKLQQDCDRNIIELTMQKRKIGKLLAYSMYDTLLSINLNKHKKQTANTILDSILSLMTEQIFSILIKEQPAGLFQNILQELYMGNNLQILNQLDMHSDTDLLKSIIQSISYSEVVDCKNEKYYWLAVFNLVGRKIIDLDVYVGLRYLSIEHHVDVQYLQKLVSKCGQLITRQLSALSVPTLDQFFQSLLSTHHICLIKLVGKLIKKNIEIIHALLGEQSERNSNLYLFLDECMNTLSPSDLNQLRAILKENIKLFTSIDANRASDLICRYFLPDLNIFIDDLHEYPFEQLKLIHSVLQLYCYSESLMKLKIKYLELLAITGSHANILTELQKENYPLDESMDICRRYDVLEAVGYLLVKSGGQGEIAEAIKVYFRIIWDRIVKKVLEMELREIFDEQFREIVMENVSRCVRICQQLDLRHHHHSTNEWFIIMHQLQGLRRTIFKNLVVDEQTCQLLKSIINQYAYPQLFRTLIVEVDHQQILQYLQSNISQFDVETIKIIIDEMVNNYLFQKTIFKVAQDLFVQTENTLRSILLRKQLAGFVTNSYCNVCAERGDLLVHYDCGHEIHPSCGQDVKQCYLCSGLSEFIFQKKINNVSKIRIEIYSRGVKGNREQVEYSISREDKMRRMSIYQEFGSNCFD